MAFGLIAIASFLQDAAQINVRITMSRVNLQCSSIRSGGIIRTDCFKVYAEVTLLFPLMVAQTFAKKEEEK